VFLRLYSKTDTMQMPKSNFLVEELICNESFQQFCLGSSLENQLIWQNWIDHLPHRKADFEEAKRLVEILNVKQGSRLQQIKALKSGLKQQSLFSKALHSDTLQTQPIKLRNGVPVLYKYIGGIAALLVLAMSVYLLSPAKSSLFSYNQETNITHSSGKLLRKTVLLSTIITGKFGSVVKPFLM
jgi:transmembrane sensor